MIKLLFFLLAGLMTNSCSSQKIVSSTNVENPKEYFLGSWNFTKKEYNEDGMRKVFPLHECMKKYKLIFSETSEGISLIKEFATGNNCDIKSNSGKLNVKVNGSTLSYFESDLKKIEKYKIYSKAKFSIVYNDIINGKATEIEDFYEKQK